MTDIDRITFVCKAFAGGSARAEYETLMGKTLEQAKKEEYSVRGFNPEFITFFNRYHESHPELLTQNLQWVNTVFFNMYGYAPHASWLEQAFGKTVKVATVAAPVTPAKVTKVAEPEPDDDGEDDDNFGGLFD